MFKILALIVFGVISVGFGLYYFSIVEIPAFQFPQVNWIIIGVVAIAASAAILSSAFVVSKAA